MRLPLNLEGVQGPMGGSGVPMGGPWAPPIDFIDFIDDHFLSIFVYFQYKNQYKSLKHQ